MNPKGRATSHNVKKTLYLANPYGFSAQQAGLLLPQLSARLEVLGAEVWEPFARGAQVDKSREGWAFQVAEACLKDVREADGVFAVVNGTPPDEGVMVELGVAVALNKPRFLFRDDFRRCTDSDSYPLNLMLFAGLGRTDWKQHYYTHIDQLADPGMALARWLG